MIKFYLSLACATLAYVLYLYFTRTFNYWKSRDIIGPAPVAIFGNIKDVILRRKNIGDVLKDIYNAYPNEKVVGVYRMTSPSLLVRDLDIIKHVLIKDFDNFVDRGIEFSKKGLGANLFHSDGDTWRVLRRQFTPLFSSGKLKNMLYLMAERAEAFVDYVGSVCDQQASQEVHQLAQKYTMTTIAACAFGLDIDTINKNIGRLKKVDELVFTSNLAFELDMMYPGILKKFNSSLFSKFVHDFFYDLVRQVICQRNGVPGSRKDFMDLILEMKQQGEVHGTKRFEEDRELSLKITEDVITAQAFIFYIAGYETSATTISFLLYELAKNSDVQENLHKEIMDVLNRYDGKVTYDAIQEMTYLNKVYSETLRMYPIVDLLRNAAMDYKVPDANLTIEKGTTILISPYAIHHDPKYYPNPEKFEPERFTADNLKDLHPCAYIPFGVGPRNCIGLRFAKLQSFVCISKLLSKFRFEMAKNTPEVIEMDPKRRIIASKCGIPLRIVKR